MLVTWGYLSSHKLSNLGSVNELVLNGITVAKRTSSGQLSSSIK